MQQNCIKQIYTKMKKKSIPMLDILEIWSASLYMIHCLAFPLLTFIPLEFLKIKIRKTHPFNT